MDWLGYLGNFWLGILGAMTAMAFVYAVLAQLMPCNPNMHWWNDLRATCTNFFYWFIAPVFVDLARTLMVIVGVRLLYAGEQPHFLPVKNVPLWVQCILILLIQDFVLYWIHRIFHTRAVWRFHAVHHSPTMLDWMSTVRFHPVNSILAFNVADITVVLLGFSPEAMMILAPFNVAYSAMVHANLNWTFGPLKYVLASPVFHRWHHTTEEAGLDKNFASTFPILDLVFGTYYMPAGQLPDNFGNGDPDFPQGVWGQLLYPFRAPAGAPAAVRRRALLATGCVCAGLAALGGCVYIMARLANENMQLADDLQKVRNGGHIVNVVRAREAWAANDMARAIAMLDELVSQGDDSAETVSLRELCRRKCLVLAGSNSPLLSTALSANGQVAVTGGEYGSVSVWDARTGKERFKLKAHAGPVSSVAVSADGSRIVTAGFDKLVKLWDGANGKEKLTLKTHTCAVLSVAISADGSRIVSGSADLTARIWNADTGDEEQVLKHAGAVSGVAICADGSKVVTAAGAIARLWDAETGAEQATFSGHGDLVYGVAIRADGGRVVTASFDSLIKVWDASGAEKATLHGHTGPVYSVALSTDGGHLVSGGKDETVRIWDVEQGLETLNLKGHLDAVTSVSLSGDGQHAISSSRDATAKIWDVPQCKPGPAPTAG